jgi:acyl-CoA synthetase (AMP-forming)/AMP-acid ligase II
VTKTHITDYLFEHARQKPDKLALVVGGRTFTWKELADEVTQTTSAISRHIGEHGEQKIVALMFPNSWEYVVSYLAVLNLGHIAMPIDVIYKSLEVGAILEQIPPYLTITDSVNKSRINTGNALVFEELKPGKGEPKLLRLPAEKQIASLVFTSGTTGKPKAAPYTHANHMWNIKVCSAVWSWTESDSLLVSLRLSHWYGLIMGLSGVLYHGNTMYLQDRFDAKETLKLLSSGKITIFTHGPIVYAKLLEEDSSKYDLSKVRLFVSGSGPLAPALWQQFKQKYGHEILEVYGSSETGRIASNLLDERIPGSPGRILPEVQVKFGENNEVIIKSPGVFPGYFKNPEATKKNSLPGGWWRTGDIGELQDGRLALKGRLYEKIRKQGYSISPRDVEWALLKHSKIKECYVMGISQPGNPNDQIAYFIVGDISEEEVKDYSKQNLPSVWRADKIIFLEALPKNPNGKPKLQMLKVMV